MLSNPSFSHMIFLSSDIGDRKKLRTGQFKIVGYQSNQIEKNNLSCATWSSDKFKLAWDNKARAFNTFHKILASSFSESILSSSVLIIRALSESP